MHLSSLALLSLVTCCFGQQSSHQRVASRDQIDPCARLSSESASQLAANSSAPAAILPPSVVLDCFRSVPINVTLARAFIDWFQPFIQLQTTLAYLKNPPAAYQRPAVDLVGSLHNIAHLAANGSYKNEFDFENDILALPFSAGDLHFAYLPYLPGVLSGGAVSRNAPLASISIDGRQLPKLYFVSDIISTQNLNASFTPSAITLIDGQDPISFFNYVAKYNPTFTDYDAEYNAMLQNVVPIVQYSSGIFNSGFDPSLKDSTTYTFENRSEATINNTISLPSSPGRFTSGQELFDAVIVASPSPPASASTPSTQPSPSTAPTPTVLQPPSPGFPTPVALQSSGAIAGYFLPQSNTAVLSVNSFNYDSNSNHTEFQTVTQEFIKLCRTSGKSSLILDLRRNLGGDYLYVYELYRQLFPGHTPFSRYRTRASNATNALGQVISQLNSAPPSSNATTQSTILNANVTFYNYHTNLQTPDGQDYDSWSDFFGPVDAYGDNFSNTASWLLSDPGLDEQTGQLVVSGYANNSDTQPSPFTASQMIILTDGVCSSGCGLFVELLFGEGVQSVVAGGRPSKNPMAVIGGTHGAYTDSLQDIQADAALAVQYGSQFNISTEALQPLLAPPPLNSAAYGLCHLNLLDNIAKDDASLTPLQFSSTPAGDCRFFYTAQDIVDVQHTWNRILKGMATGGKDFCVVGSLKSFNGSANTNSTGITSRTASPAAIGAKVPNVVGWIVTVSVLFSATFWM